MTEGTQETEHACGPDADAEFFAAIHALMSKYPDLEGKYRIVCADHETDILKIDPETQVACKRFDGQTIITEFVERKNLDTEKYKLCCEWFCPINKPCYCTAYWC